ncbi:hypothetical protein E2P81_ATG03797 [Venturia nashicola]|nr:hypothetical protein E2P81_ATG03797 [Venturia nashicola]
MQEDGMKALRNCNVLSLLVEHGNTVTPDVPIAIVEPETCQFSRPVSAIPLSIQFLDVPHQIAWSTAPWTILPLPTIHYTPNLLIQPHRATFSRAHTLRSLHTLPQQSHPKGTILSASTIIQLPKINATLQRTLIHQFPRGNLRIPFRQTECKSEIDFWIRVEFCGAEFDDVTETFGGTVHTCYVAFRLGSANVGEGEVYFGEGV